MKRLKKFSIFTLSILLSFLMVMYLVPMQVYAAGAEALRELMASETSPYTELSGTETGDTDVDTHPEADVRTEMIERRTATSKTFLMDDGSYRVAEYGTTIHYADENGVWQEIDNTLSSVSDTDGAGFAVENNARVKFANNTASSKLLTVKNGNYQISFGLVGGNKTRAAVVTNPETPVYDASVTKYEQLSTLSKLLSKVTYPEVFDGTDLEYVMVGETIKENLVLSEPSSDGYTYTFELKLNKLTATLQEDGSILLSDESTGEAIYTMPAPFMYDSAGATSDAVSYMLTAKNNGKHYTLTVTADPAWIEDSARVFPVTIDPTIGAASSTTIVSATTYGTGTTEFPSGSHIAAGYYSAEGFDYGTVKTHLQFTIPSLPDNTTITNAQLVLEKPMDSTHTEIHIAVHQLTSSATETYIQGLSSTSTVVDYLYFTSGYMGRSAWNITESVRAWSENSASNYGLALYSLDGNEAGLARFYGTTALSSKRPYLEISCRSIVGLEDYYTYTAQSAGNAGTFYINDFTGNLVGELPLSTSTDAIMPYTPTLYYNSALGDSVFTHTTPGGVTSAATSAKGWKWNFQQTITPILIDGRQHYIWVDGDGTEHWFSVPRTSDGISYCYDADGNLILEYENGTSEDENPNYVESFYDEDGLNLQLIVESGGYSIKENEGITKADPSDAAIVHFTTDGYMDYVRDLNGNVRYFRQTSGKVTSITLKPAGGAEITQFTIIYASNGLVYSVSNTVTGVYTTFAYADVASGSYTTFGTSYLRSASHYFPCDCTESCDCDNFVNVLYEYSATTSTEGDGKLTNAIDERGGYKIGYTYDSKGCITQVCEYAIPNSTTSTTGQTIKITYGTRKTTYRSSGKDDTISNSDDIYTILTFDYFGRTVSSHSSASTAQTGTIYGSSSAAYTSPETGAQKNKISGKTTIGSPALNYLLNPSFEAQTASRWTLVGGASFWNTDSARSGAGNLAVQGTSSMNYGMQSRYLTGNRTYTFSAYVKASDTTANAYLCVARSATLSESTPSTYIFGKSDVINYNTAERVAGGYIRLSVTFTLTSARTCYFYLVNNGSSYAQFDDAMLEQASAPSQFSFVAGGDMYSMVDWTYSAGAKATASGYIGLKGLYNNISRASQRVYLNYNNTEESAVTGKSLNLVLSGWGKANSAYNLYEEGMTSASYQSVFGILAIVYLKTAPDADLSMRIFYMPFSQDIEEWQFASTVIRTTAEDGLPLYMDIVCCYDYNVNTANFDNISLVEDSAAYTAYDYNGFGQVTSTVSSSGTSSTGYEYSGTKLSGITDQQGSRSDITYDAKGNITKVSQTVGSSVDVDTNYEYAANGLLTEMTMVSFEDATKEFHEAFTYSTETASLGQTLSAGNTFGTTYSRYNSVGQLTTQIDALGSGLVYTYDNFGNVLSVTMKDFSETSTGETITNAPSVRYSYNSKLQLSSITTGSSRYAFTYDDFGNTLSVSVGNRTLATYTYGANNGKMTKMTYGNGTYVEYSYDTLDRVSQIWYNGDTEQSYEYIYNGDGNLATVIDNVNGIKLVYEYDASGHNTFTHRYLLSDTGETLEMSRSVKYDDFGRESELIYAFDFSNNNYWLKYTPVYDGDSSIITAWEVAGSRLAYTLDDFGRPTKTTLTGNKLLLEYEYTYDENETDRLYDGVSEISETSTRIRTVENLQYVGSTSRITKHYTYTYDANGNITAIVTKTGTATKTSTGSWGAITWGTTYYTTYTYDKLGQLIREDNQQVGKTFVYTYDDAGNIVSNKTYSYTTGSLASATPSFTFSFTYGDTQWGDLLTAVNGMPLTYDAIGNITSVDADGDYPGYFTWEDGRLLTEYRMPYDSTSNTTLDFKYDDAGIRTEKIYWDNVTPTNSTKHEYVTDGASIVREIVYSYVADSSSPTGYAWAKSMTVYYFYDDTGAPLGMRLLNNAGTLTTYYYRKNLQGDILGVLTADGYEVVTYTYDAWGRVRSTTYAATSTSVTATDKANMRYNPFRYRGYYYDTESSFYYLQSRYYNPAWGRFINADGYVNANGDLLGFNMFAYCGNNPVMYSDPTGEFSILALAAVLLFTPVGGTVAQTITSIACYGGMAVASIWDEDVRSDMNAISWNPFNADASAVCNSSKVSFYNGVPVFLKDKGRSGSFYFIALNRIDAQSADAENVLRHERGHNTQAVMMGIASYGLMIALPSAARWSNRPYYDRPWEITADVFGGVTSRNHNQEDINRGYWYLGISSLLGPIGYLFLLGEY